MPRLLVLLPFFLLACAPSDPPRPADPAAEAVFALLGAVDTSAVALAFHRLDRLPHTVTSTLTVHDGDGRVLGTASRTVRRTPTVDGIAERLLAADSTGSLPAEGFDPPVQNPLPGVLPDDPAYLSPRTREHYRYAMAPDTTLGGRRYRIAEASLRPDASAELPVRRVRYVLAPEDDTLWGLHVERRLTSVLFDEANAATVLLRPGPDGAPLPWRIETDATVDTPGYGARVYRLAQRIELDGERAETDDGR